MTSKAKRSMLVFIIGLTTGVGASVLVGTLAENPAMLPPETLASTAAPAPKLPVEVAATTDALKEENDRAYERIRRLEKENLELSEKMREMEAQVAAKAELMAETQAEETQTEEAREAERLARRMERIGGRLGELADKQYSTLVLRLGLDESQQPLLSDLLNQQTENRKERILARMNGEADSDAVAVFDMEDELAKILSPEQMEAYNEYREDEVQSRVNIMANFELSRLSTSLAMSEEQQDAAFQALAPISEQRIRNMMDEAQGDPEFNYDAAKRAALEEILTPQQLEVYKAQNPPENDDSGNRRGGGIPFWMMH